MGKMVNINNVYVYYARLNAPVLMNNKERDPNNKLVNHEFVLKALLPVKEMEKLRKDYRKANVKALNETKFYTAEQFEKTHKVPAPDPEVYANEDGEYEIIKFNKSAAYKDGSPTRRPQVVGFNGKDKKGLDVGPKVLLGNGTLLNLQLSARVYKVPQGGGGTKLDLFAVQVVDLIEYISGGLGFEGVGEIPDQTGDEPDEEENTGGFDEGDQPEPEEDNGEDEVWEDD